MPPHNSDAPATTGPGAFFEQSAAPLCILGRDGRLQHVNRAFANLLGEATALVGQQLLDFVYPEDLPRTQAVLQSLEQGAPAATCECRCRCRDGHYHWLDWTLSTDPATGLIYAATTDITTRRQAEAALHQSEANLRQIIDLVPHPIWAKDRAGRLVFANRRFAELIGAAAPEALVGTQQQDWMLNLAQLEAVQQEDVQVIETGEPLFIAEDPFTDPAGQPRFFQTTKVPFVLAGAGERVALGIAVEITGLKQRQDEIQAARDFYLTLFEDFPVMVWRTDSAGRCDYVNRTWLRFTGRTLAEELAFGWQAGLHPDDRAAFDQVYWAAMQARQPYAIEYRLRHHSGQYRWLAEAGAPFALPDGTFQGFIGAAFDITDRKQAEEALARTGRRVSSLHAIDRAILKAKSVDEVAQAALDYLRELVPCWRVNVSTFDWSTAQMVTRAIAVAGETQMVAGRSYPLEPVLLEIFRSGQPWYISDLAAVQGQFAGLDLLYAEGAQTYLGVPLMVQDELIGMLGLAATTPAAFTPDDIQIAGEVADQIALALHEAALVDQIRRYAQSLEKRVAERTAQLEAARERVEAILNSSSDAFILASASRGINQTNLAFDRLFACGPDDYFGAAITALVEPADRPALLAAIETALAGQVARLEVRALRRDGTVFDADIGVAAVESAGDATDGFVCNLHDISARKQAEQALRESEERFRSFFELPLIGMATTDIQGRWLLVNDKLCELLGYSREELTAMTWADVTHPDDLAASRLHFDSMVAGHTDGYALDKRYVRKDGQIVTANLTVRCVRDNDGQMRYVAALIQDITERKRAEEALHLALQRERELNELKSRFVSMVSHEFRTPLAAIRISLETIRRYRAQMSAEQQAARFDKITHQIDHLTAMLEDVLTIGRIQSGKLEFRPEPVNLCHFCRGIVSEVGTALQARHRIEYTCNDEAAEVALDLTLMRQVITNLLTNALKYSPDGRPVTFRVNSTATQTVLQVRDQGIGIAARDQQKLFEAFHRGTNVGNIPGSGLGLSIARQAVDLHGGTITCESQVGVGTTFTVTLPA